MIFLNLFLKEFLLELLRISLIAALPVIIASLEHGNLDLKVLAVAVALAVLRAVDRALHESGVAEKGITRF